MNHDSFASSCDICSSSYSGRPIVVMKMRDGSYGLGRGWRMGDGASVAC